MVMDFRNGKLVCNPLAGLARPVVVVDGRRTSSEVPQLPDLSRLAVRTRTSPAFGPTGRLLDALTRPAGGSGDRLVNMPLGPGTYRRESNLMGTMSSSSRWLR